MSVDPLTPSSTVRTVNNPAELWVGGWGKISWRRDRDRRRGDVSETMSGLSCSCGLNSKLEDEMRSEALVLVSDDALVKLDETLDSSSCQSQ